MALKYKEHASGQQTLDSSIGALTSGSTVEAAGSLDLASFDNYPHADFVLTITFATETNIENKVVELLARELNVDGTTDTPVPTATYRHRRVATFKLKNTGSGAAQTLSEKGWDLPQNAEYYVFQESGQASSGGASLKATPFTHENS